MGTNFYTLKGRHIGKRSAAGPYCWDCGRTLCLQGDKYVHYTRAENGSPIEWVQNCPRCNKRYEHPLDFYDGAAGRELGFNKKPFERKTGIQSCSSFSWAMREFAAFKLKYVVDEYKRKFTIGQFKDMLTECPIQFHEYIGLEFC